MPSVRSSLTRHWVRRRVKRLLASSAPIEAIRRRTDGMSWLELFPRGVREERTTFAGLPAAWLTPHVRTGDRTMLYLHGGGYCFGSIAMYRRLAARLAVACCARVLLPEYRHAPEHPYPAALDDAERAYRELLNTQCGACDLVLAGDSAGANLTLSLALRLRDAGAPLPAALLCISPWTDMACDSPTHQSLAEVDPMLPAEQIRLCAKAYAQDLELTDPRLSPRYADLRGLPPLIVQCGTEEILLDDSRRLAHDAETAGVHVTYREHDRMWHVWHLFAAFMPEGRAAIAEAAELLERHWPSPGAAP